MFILFILYNRQHLFDSICECWPPEKDSIRKMYKFSFRNIVCKTTFTNYYAIGINLLQSND